MVSTNLKNQIQQTKDNQFKKIITTQNKSQKMT